jgi:hypothetical protein
MPLIHTRLLVHVLGAISVLLAMTSTVGYAASKTWIIYSILSLFGGYAIGVLIDARGARPLRSGREYNRVEAIAAKIIVVGAVGLSAMAVVLAVAGSVGTRVGWIAIFLAVVAGSDVRNLVKQPKTTAKR